MTDRLITDWNFAICSSQLSKTDRLKEILEGVARSEAPMLTIDTKMWKQRAWSEDLLNRAIEFHGHGCPFMVIGLKIGLAALRTLDLKGWFDVNCCVNLR